MSCFPSQWLFRTDGDRMSRVLYRGGYLTAWVSDPAFSPGEDPFGDAGIAALASGTQICNKQLHLYGCVLPWSHVEEVLQGIDVEERLKSAMESKLESAEEWENMSEDEPQTTIFKLISDFVCDRWAGAIMGDANAKY